MSKEETKKTEANTTKESEKEAKTEKISLLKRGDYIVHVLIEDLKNLIKIKECELPEPIVKITCFEKSDKTDRLETGRQDHTYNRHMYFEKADLSVDYLTSAKIKIEVYDYQNAEKENFFGRLEFDAETLYSQPNHSIQNKWYALSNNESADITQVRGFIKLSLSILNVNDRLIELKPNEYESSGCILPPQVKHQYQQLRIYFLKAEKLPNVDKGGRSTYTYETNKGCQVYIILEHDCKKYQTNVAEQIKGVAEINQFFDVPITEPTVQKELLFKVYDKGEGVLEKDKQIGSFSLNIENIKKKLYDEVSMTNIYGGYVAHSKNDEVGTIMNINSDRGSAWVGRLFFKIDHSIQDNPTINTGVLTSEEVSSIPYNISLNEDWMINIKLFDIYFPPKTKTKYAITIRCQESSYTFGPKSPDLSFKSKLVFNECASINVKTATPNYEDIPDIFIYLMDEDLEYAIAYQRLSASELTNDDICLIKLLPEPTTKKCSLFCESGLIKIRMHVFHKSDYNLLERQLYTNGIEKMNYGNNLLEEEQDNPYSNIMVPNECTVIVAIYMTRHMVSGDSDGMNDPYVTFEGIGETKETKPNKDTINGKWMELQNLGQVPMNIKDKSTWPVLKVKVKDKDNGLKELVAGQDVLGFTYINLSETNPQIDSYEMLPPKWYTLYLEKSNKPQGELLLSFYIFTFNPEIYKIQFNPELAPYTLEINALGLRDLKPLSFFPVKKPIINFQLDSVNISPDPRDKLESITTQPKDKGANPNITSVIKTSVKLSKDVNFIPDLQCSVEDHILGKMLKKNLGIFMLNTKALCKQTKFNFEKNKAMATKILELEDEDKKEQNKEDKSVSSDPNTSDSNEKSQKKDKAGMLNTSTDQIELENVRPDGLHEPLVEENKEGERKKRGGHKKNKKRKFRRRNLICYTPDELVNIYKGLIDNKILENKKDRQNFFVLKPAFTEYVIPGSTGNNIKKYFKEDIENIPSKDLYFSVGSNKGKNEIKVNTEKLDDKINIEADEKKEQTEKLEKTHIINNEPNKKQEENVTLEKTREEKRKRRKNKQYSEFTTTKHYRRIYGCNLEDVKELGLCKPFYESSLIREKYEDKATASSIIETMSNKNFRIIARYPSKAQSEEILEQKRTIGHLRAKKNSKMNEKKKMFDEEEILKSVMTQKMKDLQQEIEDETLNFKSNISDAFDTRPYGKFKALVRVSTNEDLKAYENFVNSIIARNDGKLPENLKFLNQFEEVSKQILIQKDVIVRVYILTMDNLANRDLGDNPSDPYIIIKIGNEIKINEKENHKDDVKECGWYKHYDIMTKLPGTSTMTIQVMDYDPLFSDDLVGETKIDLEDRYFDQKWINLPNKPIETRHLTHPDYGGSQGTIKLWVEIFEKDDRDSNIPWNIEPQPQVELELRLIIWETEKMKNMDIEDTSDIYINAFLDDKDIHSTDVHYRCQQGNASFNWRMLIPFSYPREHYNLKLLAYDNDILAKDDFICGATLNIKRLVEDAALFDTPVAFTKDYFEDIRKKEEYANLKYDCDQLIEFVEDTEESKDGTKFWVQLKDNVNVGSQNEGGRVLCSLEVLPKWKAELLKVGKGRDEPNVNPYLPPPTGRITFYLNPITFFNQFVGPKFRKKCCCIICIILCILYLVIVIPYVIYHLGGEVVNPFNYIKKDK